MEEMRCVSRVKKMCHDDANVNVFVLQSGLHGLVKLLQC